MHMYKQKKCAIMHKRAHFFPICKLPLASFWTLVKNTVYMIGGSDQNCKQSGHDLRISVWENLHFHTWFPFYRKIQSWDICQACTDIYFSVILNSLCTIKLFLTTVFPRLTLDGQIWTGYLIKQFLKGLEYKKKEYLAWHHLVCQNWFIWDEKGQCVFKKRVTVSFKNAYHFQEKGYSKRFEKQQAQR